MNNAFKWIKIVAMVTLTALISTSCIKEDLSDCPLPFDITVRALDSENNDITADGDVQSVVVFIFDEKGYLIDRVMMGADQVKARTPIHFKKVGLNLKDVTFVAWGNLSDQDKANLEGVKKMDDLVVALNRTRAAEQLVNSPEDLFSGKLVRTIKYGSVLKDEDGVIDIYRRTASVNITVIGYEGWLKRNGYPKKAFDPKDLKAAKILFGTSPETYTLVDQLGGELVIYRPTGTMNNMGDYRIAPFRVYPSLDGKLFSLDFWVNDHKALSFTKDSTGKPILPVVGKMLNLLIDFRSAEVSITVVVTPWNIVHQFVQY
ncbi:FimB/Mfa2 family fimbrial subunit [Porphyromonas levii]|uniref:FimB/Mfa2 family fimbrial subunit n=1 Tax=Porphyromonas levii TaxID=28114 RepID=UPI000477C855|nr:FimB/Mfa2 family fimbrial subunit [Porphyromonas levii]MBR8763285.1 hypothetical protein [Porphyromonas levii]